MVLRQYNWQDFATEQSTDSLLKFFTILSATILKLFLFYVYIHTCISDFFTSHYNSHVEPINQTEHTILVFFLLY